MSLSAIKQVVIYTGHHTHPLLGPYAENVRKRIQMFENLNHYRIIRGRNPWRVVQSPGERLVQHLHDPKHTLLALPAGQSTNLDTVFSSDQLGIIQNFFENGGRGYLTCGASYWASKIRMYNDLCTEQPTQRKLIIKKSRLPLFKGTATGPLCPHASPTYKVGFYSDAVEVESCKTRCTILLSGGGSFHIPKEDKETQVLAKYPHSELMRCGKSKEECFRSEIAAILVKIKRGAAILSMFHPYYNSKDIDAQRYNEAFPGSGTNWARVAAKLSSEENRMNFVLDSLLFPLEDLKN